MNKTREFKVVLLPDEKVVCEYAVAVHIKGFEYQLLKKVDGVLQPAGKGVYHLKSTNKKGEFILDIHHKGNLIRYKLVPLN